MVKALSISDHTKLQKVYNSTPDRGIAAKKLGLTLSAYVKRVGMAKIALGPDGFRRPVANPQNLITDEQCLEAVNALVRYGSLRTAGIAMQIHWTTVGRHVEAAANRGITSTIGGNDDARKAIERPLPSVGKVNRFFLSCAQADTLVHEPTWTALVHLAAYAATLPDADLVEKHVATYTYNRKSDGSAKRGTKRGPDLGLYDPRVEPFCSDQMIRLAPKLFWNGHFNVLPTAADPLSGLENYNYRASSVFPHAKQHMRSVATTPQDAAKLQYTTGTVTKRNYIQKKAGQKAEFDHVYGALLVEVDDAGRFYVRQLNTDGRGRIYDAGLMVVADKDGVRPLARTEATIWGDIHERHMTNKTRQVCWGFANTPNDPPSLLDVVRSKRQVFHDLLDFESQGHHNRKDPYKMFSLYVKKRTNVREEVAGVHSFFKYSGRTWCESVVIRSNHNDHMDRWMAECDWREDLENAEFLARIHAAKLGALRAEVSFNSLRWACEDMGPCGRVRWLDPNDSYIVCKDASGGIELCFHGDKGPGGARGSLKNLSRLGRKVVIGHGHGAGIINGAWQVGVMALGLDYIAGSPDNWSISVCIVHENGKRQMVTIFAGKWRA